MAELFKNIYNEKFFAYFMEIVVQVKPEFDQDSF